MCARAALGEGMRLADIGCGPIGDLYAFVSPDRPDTVTLIANYIPLEDPPGGPKFFEFGDDVLYQILVDNDGDARAEVTFQFRFQTQVSNPYTFLYNTGPITDLTSTNWNRRQVYSVTMITPSGTAVVGSGLACPPCNIGPCSTPNYAALTQQAIHALPGGVKVFAGQRLEVIGKLCRAQHEHMTVG